MAIFFLTIELLSIILKSLIENRNLKSCHDHAGRDRGQEIVFVIYIYFFVFKNTEVTLLGTFVWATATAAAP